MKVETFNLNDVLRTAAKKRASDVHLAISNRPFLRVDGKLIEYSDSPILNKKNIEEIVNLIISDEQKKQLEKEREIIFSHEFDIGERFRINIFYQKGALSLSLRLIPKKIPKLEELGLPKRVINMISRKSGLIIVAGPYGSGRTTTAAAMIEYINRTKDEKIITIERPIEYLFSSNKSIIEQREVGVDVKSFAEAIKSLEKEDIDIVVIDECQEKDIITSILQVARTNRLIFFIINSISVISTIEDILSGFSVEEQKRGQELLSEVLIGIVVQRLVPRVGGGQVLAPEVLVANEAVKALIAGGRIPQISGIIQTSRTEGMINLEQSLAELVKKGDIIVEDAVEQAMDKEGLKKALKNLRY